MQKIVFWSLISIGSAIGAWLPSMWHAGVFSLWGIAGGMFGGVAGWWAATLLENFVNP